MTKVIKRAEAHYYVQEVEFGRVYQWRPKSVMIECECGEINTLTASKITCEECGAEHTGLIREDLTDCQLEDKDLHPWRYSEIREDAAVLAY